MLYSRFLMIGKLSLLIMMLCPLFASAQTAVDTARPAVRPVVAGVTTQARNENANTVQMEELFSSEADVELHSTRFSFLTDDNAVANTESTKMLFVNRFKDIAVSEMERSGIPASIILGQALVESGSGNSKLARESKNYFGIKCGTKWAGETYYIEDDDFDANGNKLKSCFRKYATVEESFLDHTDYLMSRQVYAPLFSYSSNDYKSWATGLKRSGYATANDYASMLIKAIEDNDLARFDKVVHFDQPPVVTSGKGGVSTTRAARNPFVRNTTEKGIFMNNEIKAVAAQPGKSLLQIAEQYDISYKRLLDYNELQDNAALYPYQYIYLQSKRNRSLGKKQLHAVEEGETMYLISQLYGIKTKCLYERNHMNGGQQPKVGAKLYLWGKSPNTPPTTNASTQAPNSANPSASNGGSNSTYTPPPPAKVTAAAGTQLTDLVGIVRSLESLLFPAREMPPAPVTPPPAMPEPTSPKVTPPPVTPSPKSPAAPTPKAAVTPAPKAPAQSTPLGTNNPKAVLPPPISPPTKTPPKAATKPVPKPAATTKYIHTHIVSTKETLYSISKTYGMTVDELKKANGLTADEIKEGQELKVK